MVAARPGSPHHAGLAEAALAARTASLITWTARSRTLQSGTFWGPAERGYDRVHGPLGALTQLAGGNEPMPPSWQYFAPVSKSTCAHVRPKGHGPLNSVLFPLQTHRFQGAAGGAMIAIVNPRPKPPPWWWAKVMPPLWQYFLR